MRQAEKWSKEKFLKSNFPAGDLCRPPGRVINFPMPPPDPETARWFAAEIQPHEPMLRAWLKSQFPSGESEIDDVVQEAFIRVLGAYATAEIRSPKAFLFVVARNLAGMRLRHRMVENTKPLAEIDCSGILDEETDVPHAVARSQELAMLTTAVQSLPTRCRQIITLRKIYGLSLKETAAELGIDPHTVVIQTSIGIRKLTEYFRRHGAGGQRP